MKTEQTENKFFKLRIKRPRNFRTDILSGLTVALALIPEAIAFSFVAHVDPKIGLYAAFMVGLVTAIFGGRPGMISGATGAIAVIFAPLMILKIPLVGLKGATEYLFAAVLLMGVIQLIFGMLKLGKFIRLVPYPVMLGFVNGLAIIIFKAQLSQFYTGSGTEKTLLTATPMIIMIAGVFATMAISYFLPKLTKAVPATLAALLTVTVVAVCLDKFDVYHMRTVMDFVKTMDPTKTTIAASLPTFGIPSVPFSLETLKFILPFSLLAASVGLIESLMTLTLIDDITETRGKGNKECIGQGLANVVNGFFGGMGGCAMIGQSMINIRGGGRGRTSAITAAVTLLVLVLFAATYVELIPLAALVGVMFMVVIGTFEWSSLRIMSKIPKSDAFIIILVSAVTVFEDLAIAVFVGIIASALIYAWQRGKVINVVVSSEKENSKVYKLNGCLFFGSVTSFKGLFDFANDPKDVIIDFQDSRVYDHSGLEAINFIAEKYAENNKSLHLLNLSKECRQLLKNAKSIVEVSVIENLDWHLADNELA